MLRVCLLKKIGQIYISLSLPTLMIHRAELAVLDELKGALVVLAGESCLLQSLRRYDFDLATSGESLLLESRLGWAKRCQESGIHGLLVRSHEHAHQRRLPTLCLYWHETRQVSLFAFGLGSPGDHWPVQPLHGACCLIAICPIDVLLMGGYMVGRLGFALVSCYEHGIVGEEDQVLPLKRTTTIITKEIYSTLSLEL